MSPHNDDRQYEREYDCAPTVHVGQYSHLADPWYSSDEYRQLVDQAQRDLRDIRAQAVKELEAETMAGVR
jgi:hypothetical protein